jgi:hypothetical protein
MAPKSKHDYDALIQEYDERLDKGESSKDIKADYESRGVNWGTFQNRRTQWNKTHRSTPKEHQDTPSVYQDTPEERQDTPKVHPSMPYEIEVLAAHPGTPEPTERLPDERHTQEHLRTPEDSHDTEVHPGTLEEYQEMIEEVQQSVPDAPHVGTEQSTPEHPSTPVVHQELSLSHSSMEHSGVPARHDHLVSTPMVHPSTPTEEDWELWNTIKSRWLEMEKMLADRQISLSTPLGTPGHTQKKTYVFDVQHITLIDRYAQDHRLDLKDVIYSMCQEFFERRGYVTTE